DTASLQAEPDDQRNHHIHCRAGQRDEDFLLRVVRHFFHRGHTADRQQRNALCLDAEAACRQGMAKLVHHHAGKQDQHEANALYHGGAVAGLAPDAQADPQQDQEKSEVNENIYPGDAGEFPGPFDSGCIHGISVRQNNRRVLRWLKFSPFSAQVPQKVLHTCSPCAGGPSQSCASAWSSNGRISSESRRSKPARLCCDSASLITCSTRWLRGIMPGLVARMASRRAGADTGSRSRRAAQRGAQSSQACGRANSTRTAGASVGARLASHSWRHSRVKSTSFWSMAASRSSIHAASSGSSLLRPSLARKRARRALSDCVLMARTCSVASATALSSSSSSSGTRVSAKRAMFHCTMAGCMRHA